jgi:hypothetical protein
MNHNSIFSISKPSAFLCECMKEDSNFEIEWLWAASQVSLPEEIRYCLERALYINPKNRQTQEKLFKLLTQRAKTARHYELLNRTLTKFLNPNKA